MKKVKIISGGYGYVPPDRMIVKTVYAGDTVSVDDCEAERLVRIGAAEIVTETPAETVATPPGGENGSGAGGNPPEDKGGSAPQEKGHLDPEQLQELTIKKLTELAGNMGIDASKCKVKADFIAAITAGLAEEDPTEDGEEDEDTDPDEVQGGTPPELTMEEPVV